MKKLIMIAVSCLWSLQVLAGTSFQVDRQQSVINWVGKKVASQHNGTIKLKSGNFDMSDKNITGDFLIDMKTIVNLDIGNPKYKKKLENHLKDPDFFDVKSHPTARFQLTQGKKISGNTYEFKGRLTIKKISKMISFKGQLTQSGNGANLVAKAKFDRTDFNIKYNSKKFFDLKALGDKLILDEVELELKIKGIKGKSS